MANMMTQKVKLSHALSTLIGCMEETRGQITKKIWNYIKDNKLQDPNNKQMIVPDTKLATILGNEPIHMTKMPKKINEHIIK